MPSGGRSDCGAGTLPSGPALHKTVRKEIAVPNTLTAEASTVIDAPMEEVWQALVDPERIKEYMFGADVISEWAEGSPITWSGEWEGKPYEDKGTILRYEPISVLSYSHYS